MADPESNIPPTKEESEEKLQQIIEEAEALQDKPVVEDDSEDLPQPTLEPEENEEQPEEVEEEPEEKEAEPSKELYKKKFAASSREAQKIGAKNRIINQAIIEADDIPEPTEEELVAKYGADKWDVMNDVERESAIESTWNQRWRAKIKEASNQAVKIEQWNKSVEEFTDNPETLVANPELEGKVDDFKEFATRDENNSIPFNTLVGSFLYEQSKNKISHKGQMFETGSGGPNDKPTPKSDKISLEEGRKLRETDYDKWKELNAAGKIDFDL